MLTRNELLTGLYGATRLALLKPDGAVVYGDDQRSALRSFLTLGLLLPAWLLMSVLDGWADLQTASGALVVHYLVFQTMVYVVSMLAQLLLTCWFLERRRTPGHIALFTRYVSAFNWASLLAVVLLLLLHLLLLPFRPLSAHGLQMLTMLEQSLLLIYGWFVAMTVLRLSSSAALGLTLLQVAANIMLAVAMKFVFLLSLPPLPPAPPS